MPPIGIFAMNNPVHAINGNHYTWGRVCDGWHLLRNEALSIIEERMPPGAEEQRHFHNHSRQFFYVLQGELAMEVDGLEHRLQMREGLEIAPGQRHQAKNSSASDVRFLVISQPPSHGDRQPG
jgi:mannose-6-phosphate isomerase-like protein (cupin superfamily)